MNPECSWDFAGKTDRGRVRANNEDSFLIEEGLGLLIVADGMGGHNSGEVASSLAVSTIRDLLAQRLGEGGAAAPEAGEPGLSPRARELEYCVTSANTLIYEKGRAASNDAGMGTTVVAALADERSVCVAHVGDSRLYRLRDGALTQLTEDHSLVGDQLRRGLITPEAAAHSVLQNILTRALGAEALVKVDVAEHAVLPGDMLLLATDGLSKMVSDEEVARVMTQDPDPHHAAETLVERACAAGGTDNITVICGRLVAGRPRGLWRQVSRLFQT